MNLTSMIENEELPGPRRDQKREETYLFVAGTNISEASSAAEVFELMPHSIMALEANNVVYPKPLQRAAWPVLLQDLDTFLVAPPGAGKQMSLVPIIVDKAQYSRVIVTSQAQSRCQEIRSALLFAPSVKAFLTEGRYQNASANVLCCTFAAFRRVARRARASAFVLDRIDCLAEQGLGDQLLDILSVIARNRRGVTILATARFLNSATLDLVEHLRFAAAVGAARESSIEEKTCTESIEVCRRKNWFAVVGKMLGRQNGVHDVTLIIVRNRSTANTLETTLSKQSSIYAQSLHGEDHCDQDLARALLLASSPGIYIGVPTDLSWLQEADRVDMLIDVGTSLCLSAFTMRQSRVKSSGIFVSLLKPSKLRVVTWLVPLLRSRGREISHEIEYMFLATEILQESLLEE
ncbi:uncharacterized protein LOC100905594 [Galendromus occidentalis]|uniref:Uncharacterized protein LOC100905594 n=1 Tax=Galendromus occidentalis TaxID=34638 RepID=A0AAJ6QWE2_9ACAR|nr:uncharacterized protein LOC100905594 [Galendromus occidentalis]